MISYFILTLSPNTSTTHTLVIHQKYEPKSVKYGNVGVRMEIADKAYSDYMPQAT